MLTSLTKYGVMEIKTMIQQEVLKALVGGTQVSSSEHPEVFFLK